MVVSVLKNLYAREVIFTVMAIKSNPRASVNAAFFLRSMVSLLTKHTISFKLTSFDTEPSGRRLVRL